jgi:hypothetical protein
MDHQLLLGMVAVIIVLSGVDVPTAKLIAIDSIEILCPDPARPVVLRDVTRSVRRKPRFVLYLVLGQVLGQWRQDTVLGYRPAIGEGGIVETPQGAEFA